MITFQKEVLALLKQHLGQRELRIEIPPDPSLGDFAFPCFSLAGVQKKSPAEIAAGLAGEIKPRGAIGKICAQGPYLNFFISPAKMVQRAAKYRPKARKATGRNVMVEYSSPNTNKPLHLGHIRNIVLGSCVSRLLKHSGDRVVQACLVNDRGIHIAKSMLAYKLWGGGKPDRKTDHFVGNYYVMFSNRSAKQPELAKEAQELLRKWESKDPETVRLWKKMNKWALDGFSETYRSLGVSFDRVYYESEMYREGRDIVMDGLKKGIFFRKDGAVVARPGGLPEKVLVRADGTTLYITQDLYLAVKKIADYSLDKSIYVVASEQNLHFEQLFTILEMLGYEKSLFYHLSYGMVYLPEGRMKSREGKVVDADDLIAELREMSLRELKGRYPRLKSRELERRARIISLAAIKFHMLKTDPSKDMTFNPEESIAFEGETGPYVLYTYARIASILRKNKSPAAGARFSDVSNTEKMLASRVLGFEGAVTDACRSYKPSIICRSLLDLCQLFNEYYHQTPILRAPGNVRMARILLAVSVQSAIRHGLNVLGIEPLEQM